MEVKKGSFFNKWGSLLLYNNKFVLLHEKEGKLEPEV